MCWCTLGETEAQVNDLPGITHKEVAGPGLDPGVLPTALCCPSSRRGHLHMLVEMEDDSSSSSPLLYSVLLPVVLITQARRLQLLFSSPVLESAPDPQVLLILQDRPAATEPVDFKPGSL